MLIAGVALACGMCGVTDYGALVGAAGWVRFRNARRRAGADARDVATGGMAGEHPALLPQPA